MTGEVLLLEQSGMCGLLIIMLTISTFFSSPPLPLRESIYRLLPQTTPENVNKNFSQYSVDPVTRYPNVSLHFLKPSQVGAAKPDFKGAR